MNRFPIENIDKVNSSKLTDKLSTSRTISLTGDISSSIQFDGSSNVSTEVEIVDNSHNHTLENITDLQSNLDTINDNISTINDTLSKKASSTHTHEISNINNLQNSLDSKGIKLSIDGTTLKLLDSSNNELSSVTTQDTDTIYTLTKSDIINKLGYTPVKSVNGTLVDSTGNVALSISTGVLTNKLNVNMGASNSSKSTVTVTSLTPYKPVLLVLYYPAHSNYSYSAYISNITNVIGSGGIFNTSTMTSSAIKAHTIVVLPTATSIAVTFGLGANNPVSVTATIYAYQ